MAKTSYFQKLLDPRWQKKRLEVLQDNEFTCESCMDTESTLHVHHKMYAKGRDPWDYELEQYSVLCESCHAEQHSSSPDVFFEVMSRLPIAGPFSKTEIAWIVAGIMRMDIKPDLKFHELLYSKGEIIGKLYWEWAEDRSAE